MATISHWQQSCDSHGTLDEVVAVGLHVLVGAVELVHGVDARDAAELPVAAVDQVEAARAERRLVVDAALVAVHDGHRLEVPELPVERARAVVVVAADAEPAVRADELARVAGVSGLTLGQVRAALGGTVAGADVVTDDAPVYRHVLTDELGAASHEAVVSDRGQWGPINAVNALHSRLSAFLAGFGGVSVRRLANYVSWFLWREAARRQDGREGRLSLLRSQVGAGRYKTSWRGLWEVPYPAKMGIVSRVG